MTLDEAKEIMSGADAWIGDGDPHTPSIQIDGMVTLEQLRAMVVVVEAEYQEKVCEK